MVIMGTANRLYEQPLTMEVARMAAFGGAVLGGGGGGDIENGLQLAQLALEMGQPRVLPADSLANDVLVVTVSAVGAPAASEQFIKPIDYVDALNLLQEHMDKPVGGLITNENGGMATVNGWLQSALSGLPVVDCPCNGRAHPTGLMGAMGLDELPNYVSRQAAVGGNPHAGRRVRLYVEGDLRRAARLVRQAAVEAGGLVGVARNPVTMAYAREHGAPGALARAVEVGQALLAAPDPEAAAQAVAETLGGRIVARARVARVDLVTRGGFDVGTVYLEDDLQLTFWNEYMTLDRRGERLGTFPDLIATLAADESRPLSSAEVKEGQEIFVLHVPRSRLRLGSGMRRPNLLRAAEEAVGRPLVSFVFPEENSER